MKDPGIRWTLGMVGAFIFNIWFEYKERIDPSFLLYRGARAALLGFVALVLWDIWKICFRRSDDGQES